MLLTRPTDQQLFSRQHSCMCVNWSNSCSTFIAQTCMAYTVACDTCDLAVLIIAHKRHGPVRQSSTTNGCKVLQCDRCSFGSGLRQCRLAGFRGRLSHGLHRGLQHHTHKVVIVAPGMLKLSATSDWRCTTLIKVPKLHAKHQVCCCSMQLHAPLAQCVLHASVRPRSHSLPTLTE